MNYKIKRLVAAIIDFYVICFVSTGFIYILTFGELSVTPGFVAIYLLSFFLLLLTKDLAFRNASIGKRIFKMEVVKTDEKELRIIDIIKRNLSIVVLLPIEILMLIIDGRRLGDIWAKTTISSGA